MSEHTSGTAPEDRADYLTDPEPATADSAEEVPDDLLNDVLRDSSEESPHPAAEDAIPGEYPEDNPDKTGEDRFDAG